MNLPNRLSLTRMALVPVIVLLMYIDTQWAAIAALAVFCIAAYTDYLDGHIARKQAIVTSFGKFIDPVADKLLVLSVLIMLSSKGVLPAWIVVVILCRELAIDSVRLVAAQQGVVIAAGQLGKIKTVTQIIAIILMMCLPFWPFLSIPAYGFVILMTVMTLWSGIDYIMSNRAMLFEDK